MFDIEGKFLLTACPTDSDWSVPYSNMHIVQTYHLTFSKIP